MVKQFLFLCIFALGLCLSRPTLAEETLPSFETSFQQGLESFQKKDYGAAQTSFAQALQARPQDLSTLVNLALTYEKLGQIGWSLAYVRKALSLQPTQEQARQLLKYVQKEGKLRELPHEIETWESMRSQFFQFLPQWPLAFLGLGFLVWSLWLWLSYFGARRRALSAEEAGPGLPLGAAVVTLLFLACLSVGLGKWKEQNETRATIVKEKVEVRTSPNENSPSILELIEGLEVLVLKIDSNWAQVTYPGSLTGWVPVESLFVTQPGGLQ